MTEDDIYEKKYAPNQLSIEDITSLGEDLLDEWMYESEFMEATIFYGGNTIEGTLRISGTHRYISFSEDDDNFTKISFSDEPFQPTILVDRGVFNFNGKIGFSLTDDSDFNQAQIVLRLADYRLEKGMLFVAPSMCEQPFVPDDSQFFSYHRWDSMRLPELSFPDVSYTIYDEYYDSSSQGTGTVSINMKGWEADGKRTFHHCVFPISGGRSGWLLGDNSRLCGYPDKNELYLYTGDFDWSATRAFCFRMKSAKDYYALGCYLSCLLNPNYPNIHRPSADAPLISPEFHTTPGTNAKNSGLAMFPEEVGKIINFPQGKK